MVRMASNAVKRARHWLTRLVHIDLGNYRDKARQISRITGRPRIAVLADMAWCAVRYEAGIYDYHEFEFYLLDAKERATVLTRPRGNNLVQMFNPIPYRHVFSDKAEFNERFRDFVGREWLDLRVAGPEELAAFLARHETFMAKPVVGVVGKGIDRLRSAEHPDPAALHAELVANGQQLVEEVVVQHPELSRLEPNSVNCLRIITFLRPDGEVVVLQRVLKMGTGAVIDNFTTGGLYTTLDEQGRGQFGAFGKQGEIVREHPVTHVRIDGFQVPLWEQVGPFVDALARVEPRIPYIGWDIAITPDGPVVIEGNYNSGVYWMRPSLSGDKQGLLPKYRAVMGF